MEKSMDLLLYFWPQKLQKMAGFSIENLQILEAFSIFQFFSKKIRGGDQNHNWLSAKKVEQMLDICEFWEEEKYNRKSHFIKIGHNSLNNGVRAVLTVYLDFNFLRHS